MRTLALFVVSLSCAGCFNLNQFEESNQSMASVNQIATHQVLYVHHFGSRRVPAEQLKITPTHTSWRDGESGRYVTIPTEEIVDIKLLESSVPKGNGFGMGAIAGASMGVIFGLSGDIEPTNKSTVAVVGGMGMGLIGAMVGQMTSNREAVKYRVIWTNPEVPIRRAVW